jgi:hypothetical protein
MLKGTLYTVIAACLAMLATSGLVAFATAASPTPPVVVEAPSRADLEAHVSALIDAQVAAISQRD